MLKQSQFFPKPTSPLLVFLITHLPSLFSCAKLKMRLNYIICFHIHTACGPFDKDLVSQFATVATYILSIWRTHLGLTHLRGTGKSRLVADRWNFKALIIEVSRSPRRWWSTARPKRQKAKGAQDIRGARYMTSLTETVHIV